MITSNMEKAEKLLYQICTAFIKLICGCSDECRVEALAQFIKFGIIGVTNTVLSYILNIVTLKLLEPLGVSWDFIAANMVAFFLSVAWSFYWNSRFVFEIEKSTVRVVLQTLLRTYIAYGFTGIVLNNILSWLWIEIVGISKYIAPLINLIMSVPLNFIINKFWAFNNKPRK